MPVDDNTTAAIRQAHEYAKSAEGADKLDDVQEYGGRARTTFESIDRSGLDSVIRHKIEEAIRHAINVQMLQALTESTTMLEECES